LRAEGAFLVSANLRNGTANKIIIQSEKGGTLKLKNPFCNNAFECSSQFIISENNVIIIQTKPNEIIDFKIKA